MAFLTPPPPPRATLFGSSSSATPPSNNFSPALPTKRRPTVAFTFQFPFSANRTYHFNTYSLVGRNKLPLSVVDQHLAPLKNRPLVDEDIKAILQHLNQWYQQHYYVCARVELFKLPTKNKPHLEFLCHEPNLVVLSTVSVGADNKPDKSIRLITRMRVIKNALGVEEGKPFIWSPTGFARLIALGIYEHVNAELKLHTPNDAELILFLRERKPGRIEPGAGISSDGRIYGDVSIVDSNFRGRAQRLRIEWQKRLDVPRASGGIAFEDMRVGARLPLSFRVRAYRDANSERNLPQQNQTSRPPVPAALQPEIPLRYESDRDGVLFDVGYRPGSKNVMLNLSPMVERVHRTGFDHGTEGCVQGVLQTSVTQATRPPVDLPRQGHIIRLEHAVGTKLFEAPSVFHKTILKLAKYAGIGPHASLATGVTMGLGLGNLPFHEQRSLGGHGSVRGYDYGELGRYRSYALGRLELRVPLAFGARGQADVPDGEADKSAEDGRKEKNRTRPDKTNGSAGEKQGAEASDEGEGGDTAVGAEGAEGGGGFFDRLPPLVGVLFGDVGVAEHRSLEVLGASYGLGVRVGGVVSVDWTTTMDGRKSKIQVGLVDRSL